MYSSRGGNSYQQQGYGGQSSYGQNSTSAYPGSSSTGPDAGSQLGMNSRHQSILAASREQDIGGYRSHPSATGPYGGQYSSLYGTGSLSSTQQVSALTAKGTQSAAVEARGGYGSLRPTSPRYASNEYVPSTSLGYTLKTDRLLAEKIPDYASIDRRQYGDRQSAYMTRDLPSDATGRYSDSAGYAHHQPEVYDRIDQAVLREQILKSQTMQTASHDSTVRQADYLAARAGNFRHAPQEVDPYTGRGDAGRSSYNTQHNPSILGAAPQRNVDSLLYSQGSTNPGYGVSLPPGRDYGIGKGLHASALESDFSGSVPSRSGHLRIDDRKDERAGYTRALDLRDESRQRERLLEREREREREREKEKERERRQREREREQERERDRKRALERERERELLQRRRALEVRRERTPVRSSKDRHASVLMNRDSPRVGLLHRLRSPVKRRDYICKVHASSLVDVERDFLSVDKRYSKLYVSPDFSKLVVNWPREDLKLSFHTPVSFEHDFVEEGNLVEQKESSLKLVDVQTRSSGHRTVWNAKVILMSGLSRSASEELCSEKLSDDRVPHMCNLLRFAVLRKDRSFMAIGGPWDPVDGPDPSVDPSSLIQTVIRYAKDVTQLDLRSCKLWNRFLEVHYDRIGTDGLFSHKEITVLFVPDLSDCLPLLDAWHEQWLAHKKVVAERERQSSLKREKEKSKERKDDLRDKEGITKDVKRADKSNKQKGSAGSGQVVESIKEESDIILAKGKEAESGAEGSAKKLNKEDSVAAVEESNVKTDEIDNSSIQESKKVVKKKIVKRIVKQKVVSKKSFEGSDSKNVEKVEEAVPNKNVKLEVSGEKDGFPAENKKGKLVAKKNVVKKVLDGNPVQTEEKKSIESGENNANLQDASQDKPEAKPDFGNVSAARGVPVKKKIIKKIIKRVPKKKNAIVAVSAGSEVTDKDGDTDAVGNDVKKAIEVNNSGEPKDTSDPQPEAKFERKADEVIQEEGAFGEKMSSEKKVNPDGEKQRVSPDNFTTNQKERSKEKEKDPKDKKSDVKDEVKRKSSKELERKKSEEPPRHPGLILQTKSCKDSKVHSLSLSLDSLLDYTDKDVEESAFELSLFAESLYEMLQYQMASRIFAFLEKLRVKFVMKRNQRKRQREEADAKKRGNESPSKRLKSESENSKTVIKAEDGPNDEKLREKGEKMDVDENAAVDDGKPLNQEKEDNAGGVVDEDDLIEEVEEEEEEEEEDPEEDLEEDEEMQDKSPQNDTSVEKTDNINSEEEKKGPTAEEVEDSAIVEKIKNDASGKEEKNDSKAEEEKVDAAAEKASEKEKDVQIKSCSNKEASKDKNGNGKDAREKVPPRKEYIVDKPVLEAFRFFDRNRAGYVRLEDMRLILHALGKYHSHRDIKELAQSALLESSTGRDDRILYEKLVRKLKD